MENSKIFGIFFIISYAAVFADSQNVTQNNYENGKTLNFPLHELKQRCQSKIYNISEILKNLSNEFTRQLSKVSKRLWDISLPERNQNSWEKIPSPHLLKSRCFEKSKFKKIFENMIDVIQLCFENDLHLKEEEIQSLSRSAASQICSYLEMDSLIRITDNECVEIMNNNENCFPSINNITGNPDFYDFNIFRNLKLDHTIQECNSLFKLWGCQEDVIKWCKNSSIKMHQTWMQNRKFFTGCKDDNNTATDKESTILDVERGRFNFTIPELLRICESKGMDLKEKTEHVNFHVFDLFLSCSGKTNFKELEYFPNDVIVCMRKHCYSNYTLQSSFERVIDSIQFCFNDADQISLKSKRNLAQNSVQAFCDKMLMGELAFRDPAGFFRSLENCYGKLEKPEEEVSNFFVLLSVPHVYTRKQCSYYAGLFACARNEFSNSSNETKAAIEAVRLRLSNCDQLETSIFT